MIGYVALSPHPPLIIPAIGGNSLEDVKATVSGMKEMARELVDSKPDSGAFEHFLSEHPGAVDLWLGGHTHAGPDTVIRGRSHVESKWGTHFINAAALTRHHGVINHPNPPKSRLLTFTEGSPEVRVQCYIHSNEFFPQGWYQPAERTLRLSKPFRLAL